MRGGRALRVSGYPARKPASHTRAEKPGAELGEAVLMVRT